jgi:hypothetical protein
MTRNRILLAAIAAAALLPGPAARAAPLDDRNQAFRVIGEAARVERAYSNCRWIRGRPDEKGAAAWRRDNAEILGAARAVLAAQGGYTAPRRAVAEDLAGRDADVASSTRAACEAFQAEARTGAHDLGVRLPPDVVRAVLGHRPPSGEPVVWRVEQRRGPDGVLRHGAFRADEDGVAACDAAAGASRGHIHLRAFSGTPDPDPDLWFAECMESPVDPVTGAAPPRKEASAGDGP